MNGYTGMTDEELALCYMNGDNKAFDLLLAHTQSSLFSYILCVVHDEDVANDVFQDTFIKIIVKLRSGLYAPTGKFGAWCMRIAHNVIMDLYRGKRNYHIVEVNEDNDISNMPLESIQEMSIEQTYINNQVLNDVKKMIDLLPATQREVVFMRFYQQMSFKEISEVTKVSINTALGRMRYALLNMRRMAKEHNMQLELY